MKSDSVGRVSAESVEAPVLEEVDSRESAGAQADSLNQAASEVPRARTTLRLAGGDASGTIRTFHFLCRTHPT